VQNVQGKTKKAQQSKEEKFRNERRLVLPSFSISTIVFSTVTASSALFDSGTAFGKEAQDLFT
jgi:hypothetical protein